MALPFLPGNTFSDPAVSKPGKEINLLATWEGMCVHFLAHMCSAWHVVSAHAMQKTRFHVAQTLGYKNGYALPSRPRVTVGGEPLEFNQLTEAALDELASTQPTLTYGNASKAAPVEFVPAHVAFDKKVRTENTPPL